jgi:hypothetical protein
MPVTWPATVVRHRDNPNRALQLQIDDVVRKSGYRCSAGGDLCRQPRDGSSGRGKLPDPVKSSFDSIEKPKTQAMLLLFVPECGVLEFPARVVVKARQPAQRREILVSISERTSDHKRPSELPVSTRRALLSISRAHATSTCSGLVPGSASRLSSSPAATSARSGGSSFRPSSRTSSGRDIRCILSLLACAARPSRPSSGSSRRGRASSRRR